MYNKFFNLYKTSKVEWEAAYNKMNDSLNTLIKNNINNANADQQSLLAEEKEDIQQVSKLLKIIQETKLDEFHRTIYNLRESDMEIATTIRKYEKFHNLVMADIRKKVGDLINSEKGMEPLECYPLAERTCFGITGPVASGKSVSEKMIRSILGNKNAAYIGSDE